MVPAWALIGPALMLSTAGALGQAPGIGDAASVLLPRILERSTPPQYILRDPAGGGGVPWDDRATPPVVGAPAVTPFDAAAMPSYALGSGGTGAATGEGQPVPDELLPPEARGAMDAATALRLAPAIVQGTAAPRTFARPEQALFAKRPGDCYIYTGPFSLHTHPVLAEHKFPQYFGCSLRVIPRLRLYPFLGFDVTIPNPRGGDPLPLVTNFVFNSVALPASGVLEVGADSGIAYLEQYTESGIEKFMILRLRDDTIKITRMDAEGRGVYAVYTISARPWAMFAHEFRITPEPVRPTILREEWTHPREGYSLRRLLVGYESADYLGYWTIPQGNRVAGWEGIALKRDARRLTGEDMTGSRTITPLDIGHFDVGFEEALTYTEPAYDAPRRWTIPLPYPTDEAPGHNDLFGGPYY
jgi:hypothetical protein